MTEQNMEGGNPFSADEAPGISLIVQMRIYDVLMGMYTEMAPDKADAMIAAHLGGTLIGPTPAFNGRFIATEQALAENEPSSD